MKIHSSDVTAAAIHAEAIPNEVVELRKLSPKVTGSLLRARDATYADGELLAKHKVLTALAISVTIRCEPCIEMYVKKSIEAGATLGEIVETLDVAMTMQGCPGEAWAQKALKVYDRLAGQSHQESADGAEVDSCCPR
jgi:AhpD family alkylhydroperoxidase